MKVVTQVSNPSSNLQDRIVLTWCVIQKSEASHEQSWILTYRIVEIADKRVNIRELPNTINL